jgi:hypothetical protein
VIHLDALYWQPGWIKPSKEERAATVETLLSRDAWIMDGNYSGRWSDGWRRAIR